MHGERNRKSTFNTRIPKGHAYFINNAHSFNVSFIQKIIEEARQNPDLAEQLRKALFGTVTQEQVLEEQKTIRQYLGLLSEQHKKFAEEMMQLREDFNKMAEEQKSMREEMIQLREEQVKLREDFNKMLGELQGLHAAQARTDQRLDRMFSSMIKGFGELVLLLSIIWNRAGNFTIT